MARRKVSLLDSLLDRGFDESYAMKRDDAGWFTKAIRVKCSQCDACTINGIACHETGCPNSRYLGAEDDE